MKALLICSEQDESDFLSLILRQSNLLPLPTPDFQTAFDRWDEHLPDMLLIAEWQPDDLAYVAQFRSITVVPIVLLSEKQSEAELIAALEGGVDLIIQRPYSPRLLGHQLATVARRFNGIPLKSLPESSFGHIRLDPTTRMIYLEDGATRRLSYLEFRLLYTLMTHSGQVLSSDMLVQKVWGYSGEGDSDLVRKLVHRVRLKVEADPSNPQYILTLPNFGYKFAA